MRKLVVLVAIFSFVCLEFATACNGGGSGRSGGLQSAVASSGNFGSGVGNFRSGGCTQSPINQSIASFNRARQLTAAKTAAYNARMYPARLANAERIRAEKVAKRRARAEIRIAQRATEQREQEMFLAEARTWKDITGEHSLVAIMVEADDSGVSLRKRDGSTVNVPLNRLSSDDRIYVATNSDAFDSKVEFLIAGR